MNNENRVGDFFIKSVLVLVLGSAFVILSFVSMVITVADLLLKHIHTNS